MTKPLENPETLEQVIADAAEDVGLARRMGNAGQAEYLEQLLERLKAAAADYLQWLSEDEAFLKSGKSHRTLRRRFAELHECGLARYGSRGQREFRACAVPPRPDVAAARQAGRTGERAA